MSRDSLVSSLPEAGWSCQTLNAGISTVAQHAGLQLKPEDYAKARKGWANSVVGSSAFDQLEP